MNSATTTSTETSNGSASASASASVSKRNGHDVTRTNGNGNGTATTGPPKKPGQKYRHVAAVHKNTRPSCLSHDSDAAPSFIGFRNLMVIVLVVGNLRLMIENIQKVFITSTNLNSAQSNQLT
jgi:diacylglycerol O-acyltransferase-1